MRRRGAKTPSSPICRRKEARVRRASSDGVTRYVDMLTSYRLAALDIVLNGVSPHHDASRHRDAFSEMIDENQPRTKKGRRERRPLKSILLIRSSWPALCRPSP